MDFLNKAFAQLSDLFRSMTPAARLTAGLLLAVVVISLGYLFTHRISGPDTDLMNGVPVSASYVAAMETAFGKAGLNSYEIRGTQILVPRQQKSAYMAALADAKALPPNIDKVFDVALEETNFSMSNREREERMKIAKQKLLSLTISMMHGIENASVLYDAETSGGLKREKTVTASVAAKGKGSVPLDEAQVESIRYLVASSVSGLKPDKVTVTDLSGHVYHGDGENGGSPTSNLYVSLTRTHEQQWRTKILGALSYVPGATVTPFVQLDPQRVNRTKSIKYDPKPTVLKETSEESTRSVEGSGSGGQPGYLAQQPNMPATLAANSTKGSQQAEDESKRESVNVVGTQQIDMETEGLTPKRVSVSIGIPSSYFEKVWSERNPPKDGQPPPTPDARALDTIRTEETTKIREFVAGMLPPAENVTDPLSLVTVKEFQDIKAPEIPPPALAENALVWLSQSWTTVGLAGLVLFGLAMLRSMVRGVPAAPESGHAPTILHAPAEVEPAVPDRRAAAKSRLARFAGGGPSLRDELSELVKEDPDAAVNILRNWIGSAG